MANTAENADFMEPGEEQLKKLQSGETDTASIIEINELRGDIGRKLSRAEEEGVISRLDAKEYSEKLRNTGNSKQEVASLGQEVASVIEESKRLIAELPSGDKEVEVFKQMTFKEKKEYLVTLRKTASDLNERADKLGELFPDAQEKLKNLEGVERAKYIEELNIRRANISKYDSMLEQDGKHFSKKSQGEYMAMFKELSIAKQADWLKQFEETQAKPRIRLSGRYEALPPKYRERIVDFYEMTRHDKEKAVVKAEEEKGFADKLYANGDYKYMSSKSRKFMKKTFIGADSHLRKAMMDMLDKVIKEEADLGRKFEDLPADIKREHPDFTEKDFEEKKKIIESLDKENGPLVQKYDKDLLMPMLRDRVIGMSSYKSFLNWFQKQGIKGMLEAGRKDVFENEMRNRKMYKERFEREISSDVQRANAHFYDLAHHERMELFEKLKKAQEVNKKAQEAKQRMSEGGDVEVKKEKPVTVDKTKKVAGVESVAAANDNGVIAANDNGAELDESQVLEEVKRAKEGSSLMKKRIRDKNIAEGLVDLGVTSDLANANVYESVRKDKHLLTQKEKDLNDKLVSFSGGKVIAESGHGKAKKVKEIDLDKVRDGVFTEDEMLDLKKEVIGHQGEQGRDVFHLQFADRKSGQKLSGAMGRQKVAEQQKGLQDDIADKVVVNMGLKAENDNASKKEKVRSIVRKNKLKVDLKEAAGF